MSVGNDSVGERRVIANIVMTLDGHTTGPDGAFDMAPIALHGTSDEMRDSLVDMTTATTVLLGRTNYEGFAGYWPTVADTTDADARDRQFARWLNAVDKIVFSTTLDQTDWANSRLARTEPADVIRELRANGGGDIRVLSSQSIIRQLLAANEIDRLEITHSPDIVAGGARLFDDTVPASRWRPLSHIPTGSGATRIVYDRQQ